MRLFIDLDTGKLIRSLGSTQEVDSISVKRSPSAEFEVQFVRSSLGTTPLELSSGATGIMEVKAAGQYDSDALAAALSWVKTGSGSDTVYTFTLDLINDALDELLGVQEPMTFTVAGELFTTAASPAVDAVIQFRTDGTLPSPLEPNTDYFVIAPSHSAMQFKVSLTQGGAAINTSGGSGTHSWTGAGDDEASETLMSAIEWVADGKINETQTFDFVLVNDVVRDTDTGSPPAPAYSLLTAQSGRTALSTGDESKAIAFTNFSLGANIAVVGNIAKPSGGDNIIAVPRHDLTDYQGSQFDFSYPIPASGYFLYWVAVQV